MTILIFFSIDDSKENESNVNNLFGPVEFLEEDAHFFNTNFQYSEIHIDSEPSNQIVEENVEQMSSHEHFVNSLPAHEDNEFTDYTEIFSKLYDGK